MIISVETLFKILNFSLLVGVLVYFIRHYGVSFIVSSMKKEEQNKQNLAQKHKKLVQERHSLESDIKDQELFFERMKKKFYLWEQIVQRKVEQHNDEQNQIQQEVNRMHNEQLETLRHKQFLKKEFPGMIKEVEQSLCKQFHEDPDKKKLYVTKLLSFLEK